MEGGAQKSHTWPKNREAPKKKFVKKFWGMTLKSRGAANSRSAPDGRHPSYATDFMVIIPGQCFSFKFVSC